MRFAATATLSSLLLLAGCQLDPPRDEAAAPLAPADPGNLEWEPLPEGRSYLFAGHDTDGTPRYTPVVFADSLALIDGDIVVAEGAAALEKLRAKLVDPREAPAAPLAKAAGFVKASTVTGGANAWPNGCIPYTVSGSAAFKSNVDAAVYEFNQGGGVSFVPWNGSTVPFVIFQNVSGTRSSSAVGVVSFTSGQIIRIASDPTRSTYLHEMGHAAGMYHEHTRPDRDNHVTIATAGVDDSGWYAVAWAKLSDGTTVGDYDLRSIMHYPSGTTTYKRANGQNYTVTMTARNGTRAGGEVLTATDRQALWSLPFASSPLRMTSVLTGMTGKVIKPFYTLQTDGTSKKWLSAYDPASGIVNIFALNADNTMGGLAQSLNVGPGFNLVTPYLSQNGSPCILFYRTATGSVKLHKLVPATGQIGAMILSATWSPGWTSIEHYRSGIKSYLFFQNTSSFAVAIYSLGSTGDLSGQTFSSTWSNWIYAKPFYSETSVAALNAYLLTRHSDGLSRILALPGTGTVGTAVADANLPGTSLGLWQSGTRAYLATMQGASVLVFDLDHTGFRTIGGTPIYRAYPNGSTIKRIESGMDYNTVSNAIVNNRMYIFRHVISVEYTAQPGSRLIGTGAPFL